MAAGISSSDGAAPGGLPRLLARLANAQPAELAAALWSFVYFFALLAAYYVLRPIRDEMAIQVGQAALSGLFTIVFLTMLVLAPVFGWLTKHVPRQRLLPWLYAFFIANLFGFWFVFAVGGEQSTIVASTFFVWGATFNLFAVSVFWSFMADLFDTSQARRLYGFIAAGGTAGALVGPSLTALFVTSVGARNMLLVSAAFLIIVVVAIAKLRKWAERAGVTQRSNPETALGGSIWAGLLDIVRSPYLLAICLFLFAYSLLSTFLYFQQAELVPAAIADSARRTQLLAQVDIAVNVLTLLLQFFAFSALIERLGTRTMLCAMPVVAIIGFAALAQNPGLATLVAFGIVRRAGEYAISKPARETLFNVLPAEQKYKAKNVIDTLVHRTGDASSSWIFHGLKGIGLASTTISWIAVPIGAAWFGVSWWLGGEARRRTQAHAADVGGPTPAAYRQQ